MGCGGSAPPPPSQNEKLWTELQSSISLGLGNNRSETLAQSVTLYGGSSSEVVVAYGLLVHGNAKVTKAIVFGSCHLYTWGKCEELHCLHKTKVTQYGGSTYGSTTFHTEDELIKMARSACNLPEFVAPAPQPQPQPAPEPAPPPHLVPDPEPHPKLVSGFEVKLITSQEKDFKTLAKMFDVSNAKGGLGTGKDVKVNGGHDDIQPVYAWKITSTTPSIRYKTEKQVLAAEMERVKAIHGFAQLTTKLDSLGKDLCTLDNDLNEKLMLHGTQPNVLLTILQNGLDEKFSDGLFGSGIYLAEDAAKIDQYVTPDASDLPDLKTLHQRLYADHGQAHPGRVFYGLVVQVALGMVIITKDGKTNVLNDDSCFAHGCEENKQQLATVRAVEPPAHYTSLVAKAGPRLQGFKVSRYQEFISFRAAAMKPAYLVAYKRINEDTEAGDRWIKDERQRELEEM